MFNEVLQCDWRTKLHQDVVGLTSGWCPEGSEASAGSAPQLVSLPPADERLYPPGKIVHLYRTRTHTGLLPSGKRGGPLYMKELLGRCPDLFAMFGLRSCPVLCSGICANSAVFHASGACEHVQVAVLGCGRPPLPTSREHSKWADFHRLKGLIKMERARLRVCVCCVKSCMCSCAFYV
jgi:hypothetical protein